MTLAQRIKAARTYAELTQAQLGEAAGLVQQAIQKLESGERKGSRHLVQIAIACGVSPGWLATGDGAMTDVTSRIDNSRQVTAPVHKNIVPSSRFVTLDHAMLMTADRWLDTVQGLEGVAEFDRATKMRLFKEIYEQLAADGGTLSDGHHDQLVAAALQRKADREKQQWASAQNHQEKKRRA